MLCRPHPPSGAPPPPAPLGHIGSTTFSLLVANQALVDNLRVAYGQGTNGASGTGTVQFAVEHYVITSAFKFCALLYGCFTLCLHLGAAHVNFIPSLGQCRSVIPLAVSVVPLPQTTWRTSNLSHLVSSWTLGWDTGGCLSEAADSWETDDLYQKMQRRMTDRMLIWCNVRVLV